mmetsp:Transcript_29149/g.43009  ORF Transcript_29149/g.43009 Transcript_29149/m.43009 type:complete len:305 (-) Transcript_29149:2470-3384(-)
MSTAKAKESSQKVRNLLEDAASPRKRPRILTVDSYLERLRTFSSSNYFAKAVAISPIECSARGWFCIRTDILECSHCHAKLAIIYDPKLDPSQTDAMTDYYKKQITTTGHKDLCIFYRSNTEQDKSMDIPLYLVSALDPDFVGLLSESSQPLSILRDHVQYLVKHAKSTTPRYPILPRLPKSLCGEDLHMVKSVLKHIGDACNPKASRLALFGWTNGSCRVCLAKLVENRAAAYYDDLLLSSHKYYCPYQCGITPSRKAREPAWKTICRRVSETNTTSTKEDSSFASAEGSWARIQSMLNEFDK